MGLNSQTVNLLLGARSRGVADFRQTLTLGRQELHMPPRRLARAMRRAGYDEAQIAAVLAAGERAGDAFFAALGCERLEVLDRSPYEGATIIHDLNSPMPAELEDRFGCVFDGGVLHYVFDVATAFETTMRLVAPGGTLIAATVANNACGHGLYQFAPELFFGLLSDENGYRDTEVYLAEEFGRRDWLRVENPRSTRRHFHFSNRRFTHMLVLSRKHRSLGPSLARPIKFEYDVPSNAPQEGAVAGASRDKANTGFVTRASRALKRRLPPAAYHEIAELYLRAKAAMQPSPPGISSIEPERWARQKYPQSD
ncbi:MAG: hypothetical protein GC150_01360 [Rhizobiales bacterium]|nr:hypothetical protein [Hyphomicrobiales bacterium]